MTGNMDVGAGVKNALVCDICFEDFNHYDRRPMVLPKCGHTLCLFCVQAIKRGRQIVCCFCRKASEVNDLVLNYTIIGCVDAANKASNGFTLARKPLCPRHNMTAQNFCCDCNAWVCRLCWLKACFSSLMRSSHKTSHKMTSIEEFFAPFVRRAEELQVQLAAVRESGATLRRFLRSFESAVTNSSNLSPAEYYAILRKFDSAADPSEANAVEVNEEAAVDPVFAPAPEPPPVCARGWESVVVVFTGFVFYQLGVAFYKTAV